jgi:hypothetical protein
VSESSRMFGLSALAWALLVLAGFGMMVLVSPLREFDIYNLEGGMRALDERPVLVMASALAYAWAGLALVLLVMALDEILPGEVHALPSRVVKVFGLIGASFFLFYGLVGGFALFELRYIRSVHSAEYAAQAYLPLTLIMNRIFAAGITVSGLWFALGNWLALQARALPQTLAYLGLGAGLVALPGFLLPGGGFGILGLLLAALWGLLVAIHSLRARPALAA